MRGSEHQESFNNFDKPNQACLFFCPPRSPEFPSMTRRVYFYVHAIIRNGASVVKTHSRLMSRVLHHTNDVKEYL